MLLSTVGFFTNQRSAEQSGTPMRESREVLLVYLLSWGVLVPIFPLHFVSLTATVLATTQVLLYILLVPRESSETALNLSFREALKAVCLNLMGFSLASIAEQQIGGFVQVGAHGTGAASPKAISRDSKSARSSAAAPARNRHVIGSLVLNDAMKASQLCGGMVLEKSIQCGSSCCCSCASA